MHMEFSNWLIRTISFSVIFCCFTVAFAQPLNDLCSFATDIQPYINQQAEPALAGPYTNVGATGNDLDIASVTGCWLDDLTGNADGSSPQVDATVWFRFDGYDGVLMLYVQPCDTNLAFISQDTQMALYSGECDSLELVACNEDINSAMYNYWSGLTTTIEAATSYYLAVDGFNYSGFGSPELPLTTGEFCLSFTQPTVAIDEAMNTSVRLFPNPTEGRIHLQADSFISEVIICNALGQSCGFYAPYKSSSIDLEMPFEAGFYTLRVRTEKGTTVHRVIRN